MLNIQIGRYSLSSYGELEGQSPATRPFCYCHVDDPPERNWNLCWHTAWFWLALTLAILERR